MALDATEPGRRDGGALLLLLLVIPVFGLYLGATSLTDWDEAWYGQIAKELLRSGDWLALRFRGEPFFDKPPLGIWAIAAARQALGESEWAARLPAAACAGATVLLLYAIGRLVFGRPRPALLAALVLLTSFPFVRMGRMAMLDAPLTCAFTLGVLGFVAARRSPRWAMLLGLALPLAWMIKGPVAVLLALTLATCSAWERDAGPWRTPWLYLGLAAGALPALAWYAAEWQRHGSTFLQAHFGLHMLGRATRALDGHQGPIWLYFVQIARDFHPWFVVLLPAIYRGMRGPRDQATRLALCWAGVVLLAFSLAATKLPWYVLPAYPALALLVGGYLDGLIEAGRPAPALGWAWAWLAVAACGYATWLARNLEHPDVVYLPALALLGAGMAAAAVLVSGRAPRAGPWAAVAATYVGLLALLPADLPPRSGWEDMRPLALRVGRWVAPGTPILHVVGPTHPAGRPSFDYYLDRPEIPISPRELKTAWAQHPRAAALVDDRDWQLLPGSRTLGDGRLLLVVRGQ